MKVEYAVDVTSSWHRLFKRARGREVKGTERGPRKR